jgi:predicted RNase H-like nuclease (RuvC/YqgF family)
VERSLTPRDAQIARLKAENSKLKRRLTECDTTIQELTDFKTLAISQLAAPHQELQRLRKGQPRPAVVRELRPEGSLLGPC